MTEQPPPLSPDVDLERANAARMYDFYLGGAHNFAVDRAHARTLVEANPDVPYMARSNRAFLGRVVRWCLDRGVTQFLDLGSGVPTVGNVHEIARHQVAGARVAYVDCEPVAVAHAGEIVASLDGVSATRADLCDPGTVLAAPGVAELIDFTAPVAVLAISCLHFVGDGLEEAMAVYRSRLVRDSVLALSHISDDHDDPETGARISALSTAFTGSASTTTLRTRAAILGLFGGFELVGPGLVDVVDWPEVDPGRPRRTGYHAGVALAP